MGSERYNLKIDSIKDGFDLLKAAAPLLKECFPPSTRPAITALSPVTIAAWNDGMKELVSNIERKLPNVADASQDLEALRALFTLQLQAATTLRLRFPTTYLNGGT